MREAEAAALKAVAIQDEASPVAGALYHVFAKRGPAIGANAGERVVFEAIATPPTTRGVFAHNPDGSGTLVAQKSGSAPEALTFKTFHRGFTNPAIDATGTIVLAAKLKGGFGEGVYVRKAGDTTLGVVARSGDPAAGLSSGFLKNFSYSEPIGVSATTASAFIAGISAMPNGGLDGRQVIYACGGGDLNCHSGSGTLTRVVAVGDAVDDRPGSEICSISDLAASLYGVAFRAAVSADCSTVPTDAVAGVFRKPLGVFAGSVATLALVGEPAEFPTSTYQQIRDDIDIDNDGAVTFRARTLTTTALVTSQFICDPAVCPPAPAAAAVSIGDTLPGGNTITRMETPRTMISDANDLAFFAKSSGPLGGQEGIYIRRANGMIETVAEKGDAAPPLNPMDPAATFTHFSRPVAISYDGLIAFAAKIKRSSGPRPSRRGIFVFE